MLYVIDLLQFFAIAGTAKIPLYAIFLQVIDELNFVTAEGASFLPNHIDR